MPMRSPELIYALVAFFALLMVAVIAVVLKSASRGRQPEKEKFEGPVEPEPPQAPAASAPASIAPAPAPETPVSLSQALGQTQKTLWGRMAGLFRSDATSEVALDDLEEILYTSDLGPQTVERLMDQVRPQARQGLDPLRFKLKEEFTKIFDEARVQEPSSMNPLEFLDQTKNPSVWMIVGVNGAGKTTTIGKISALLAQQGKKVLVAAGDTFRAAAGQQLKTWTERAQVEIFHPEGVKDPGAVAFDAVTKGKARGYDVVLIDTAGRLHTQSHLMDELKKIKRVLTKVIPDAPHEILIVLDANNGQNSLHQAKEFHQALGLTGIVLTKMDGTAKGGVAIGVAEELKIPIRLIGIGEKIGDLRAFSSREFIDSILGNGGS